MGNRDAQSLNIFVQNITSWGPGARAWLGEHSENECAIFLETHVSGDEMAEMLTNFDAKGWKAVATPARQGMRSKKAGGLVVAAKKRVAARSLRHLTAHKEQRLGAQIDQPLGPVDFFDFVPLVVDAEGCQIAVVGVYLTSSMGLVGENLTKLANIAAVVHGMKCWIVAGDWNVTPEEVEASRWLEEVGGRVVVPGNRDYTCRAGKGRLLDFAVASAEIATAIDITAVEDPRWGAHMGLDIGVKLQVATADCWTLNLPKAFVHPAKESKAADPDSKRQRALKEKECRRQQWYASKAGTESRRAEAEAAEGRQRAMSEKAQERKRAVPPHHAEVVVDRTCGGFDDEDGEPFEEAPPNDDGFLEDPCLGLPPPDDWLLPPSVVMESLDDAVNPPVGLEIVEKSRRRRCGKTSLGIQCFLVGRRRQKTSGCHPLSGLTRLPH